MRKIPLICHNATRLLDPTILEASISSKLISSVDISASQSVHSLRSICKILESNSDKPIRINARLGICDQQTLQVISGADALPLGNGYFHSMSSSLLSFQVIHIKRIFQSLKETKITYFLQQPELALMTMTNEQNKALNHQNPVWVSEKIAENVFKKCFSTFAADEEQIGVSFSSASILKTGFPLNLKLLFELSGGRLRAIAAPWNLLELVTDKARGEDFSDLMSSAKAVGLETFATHPLSSISSSSSIIDDDSTKLSLPNGVIKLAESPKDRFNGIESRYAASRDELFEYLEPDLNEAEMEISDKKAVLEACAFLKKLIFDLENEMLVFENGDHFREDLQTRIIPLINEKIEGLDEDTFKQLTSFFVQYEALIEYLTETRIKEFLEAKLKSFNANVESKVGHSCLKNLESKLEHSDCSIQSVCMEYILRQDNIDNVVVGMRNKYHLQNVNNVLNYIKSKNLSVQ